MSEEARQALSKWLRHYRQDDEEGITVTIARQACDEAADLIDQQAAEIADLKLRIDRWNSGDNSIGAKEQVKRLMRERDIALIEITRYARATGKIEAERDEWRRRAWWLWDRLIITLDDENDVAAEVYPEAAQWFEEN